MSDPFYFAFNVRKQSKALLCHAVIFASFLVPGENTEIPLCTEERDPRMQHFIRFVHTNWIKEHTDPLKKQLKDLEEDIAKRKQQLKELDEMIEQAKKEQRTCPQIKQ